MNEVVEQCDGISPAPKAFSVKSELVKPQFFFWATHGSLEEEGGVEMTLRNIYVLLLRGA